MDGIKDTSAPQDPTRRSLLKLGLAGTAALGAVGFTAGLAGCHRTVEAAAQGYRFLRDADVILFRALTPVVLEGAMPQDSGDAAVRTREILRGVDLAGLRLDLPAQSLARAYVLMLNSWSAEADKDTYLEGDPEVASNFLEFNAITSLKNFDPTFKTDGIPPVARIV